MEYAKKNDLWALITKYNYQNSPSKIRNFNFLKKILTLYYLLFKKICVERNINSTPIAILNFPNILNVLPAFICNLNIYNWNMNKEVILGLVFFLIIFYPAVSAFNLHQAIYTQDSAEIIEQQLSAYQLSIWLSWLVMVIASIYHKWTTERNNFFYFTYIFLLIGFGIFGFYFQKMVNLFDIETSFQDKYTLGVFAALRNLAVAGILTAFLQAAVWWFTRRWHRR